MGSVIRLAGWQNMPANAPTRTKLPNSGRVGRLAEKVLPTLFKNGGFLRGWQVGRVGTPKGVAFSLRTLGAKPACGPAARCV